MAGLASDDDITTVPKVELHVHLNGSITEATNMTISSDDPPFFNTTLTDELRHVVRVAGLTRHDLAELQRRAARDSFASPEDKAGLLDDIERWAIQ